MEKFLNDYVSRPSFKEQLEIPQNSNIVLEPLGQGEYNVNYSFTHPVSGKKLVLRRNTGSQLHLDDQIGYEFSALKDLERSGRTPKAYFCDSENSILVMEHLPGRALNYLNELPIAAKILADIHSVPVPDDTKLLKPKYPALAIFEECLDMAREYLLWDEANSEVSELLMEFIEVIGNMPLDTLSSTPPCIVNTELNNANFLINPNGQSYLIDWEKPILSEPAQDLAHLLVPTTTFWKTNVTLGPIAVKEVVDMYIKAVDGRFALYDLKERFPLYFTVTCFRGVSWCAMAMREYSTPGRAIVNEFAFNKIKSYLSPGFLRDILNNYVKRDFLR